MGNPSNLVASHPWAGWEKVLFRFFFIYFLLWVLNLDEWSLAFPGWQWLQKEYDAVIYWAADVADKHLFHIHPAGAPIPVNNGSGDTSHFWAGLWLFVLLAAIGSVVWSILDRRRNNYDRLGYWLRTGIRYFIAMECFQYGILKLFHLQMYTPTLSQLATPLGDFGPMRLCWMFMGYSTPYEVFSGAMEVIAGLLLLYRPTVTLGLLAALGVFINVMTLNLSYDIPVKGDSIMLTICCLFLLSWDYRRLFSFLALNQSPGGTNLYTPVYSGRGMRIARLILKAYFIYCAIGVITYADASWYARLHKPQPQGPIPRDLYDVKVFAVNGDTIPPSYADTTRWKDIIFENRSYGSVGSHDTSFNFAYGYGRGFFHYEVDTAHHLLKMTKSGRPIMQGYYEMPDSNTVCLRGTMRQDSVYIVLQRTYRHFWLSEWEFHWVSEVNR
jgi:hypothetical protein